MSQPSTDMETDQQLKSPNKRGSDVLVDPDDASVISSSKKSRVEPDTAKKVKCLKFIASTYAKILSELQKTDATLSSLNITLGNQIANIVFTAFTINRQKANNINGNAQRKASDKKSFTITSKGKTYTITVTKATEICTETATENGLEFKQYSNTDPNNWYGTAAPYLDFFVGNALRLTELRVGHGSMPIGKEGEKTKAFPVEKYGLNGAHHILLEGCTFPPEKRSSMAQSLGPMTALLCHIRTDEKYRKKWTDAAKRSMAHIPIIDEILDIVKGKPASEIRSIISLLADILLITTARQAHRMFFPLNIFAHVVSMETNSDGNIQAFMDKLKKAKVGGDKLIEGFNVSGNGGFYFYEIVRHLQWEMEGSFSEIEAMQVFFHSIFGTYKEDLKILEQITTLGTWNTREELGGCFQKQTSGKSIQFTPPALTYYSKLTSANQTGLLATSYLQISSIPTFSGIRTQHFSDAFFEQLGKRTGAISTAKTIPQIAATLTDLLSKLRQDLLDGGKKMEVGTVSWRSVENMDIKKGGAEVSRTFSGGMKFFLGRQ